MENENEVNLTVKEVSIRLSVNKTKIYSYLKTGKFPNAIKDKNRKIYLIPLKDLESFILIQNKLNEYFEVNQIAKLLNKHPESIREKLRKGKFINVIKDADTRKYYVHKDEVYNLKKSKQENIIEISNYRSIKESSKFLKCHKDSIRSYIKKGVIKDYLLRNNSEGYLIHINELERLKQGVPEGYLLAKDAAVKMGINKARIIVLAKTDEFSNSIKKEVNKGKEKWLISKIDIQNYLNKKEKLFKTEDPLEFSTVDAVNKFIFDTKSINMEYPEKIKTIDLYKNYAISKLSNSNAREETLKKKVSYYVRTIKIILQKLEKNFDELSDTDINKFLSNKEIVEYVKQYFIGFLQYISQESKEINFKNDYKTSRNTISETEIYTKTIFNEYFEYVKDLERHIENAIKRKTYAQTWLYIIMHLMNAWRSGDIIYGLPQIDFEGIEINDLDYFKAHRLTRVQSQIIINQVHLKIGKIKFSKTGALGQFLCIESLALPFATAISIVELHRRKSNEKLMLSSIRSRGINKLFFERNRSLLQFDSLKMNRSLITYLFHHVSKSEGDAHFAYETAQILRSHKDEETTSVYIKFSDGNNTLDEISFNICERGHFGWVFNSMINLFFDQNNQTMLDRTKMIKKFQERYTIQDIETLASFLLNERNRNESIALRLARMSKENLKKVIIKVFRGEMPAKIEHAQCFSYPYCPYSTKKTCFGCEFLIPTDYLLFSVAEEINSSLLNLYNSNTKRSKERELYILKQLFILVNQAIVEKGEEYTDTFIQRKQLKEVFVALIDVKSR
ncbi:helix-turn-helix transcriptional regulator [Lysinibacillus irui]|uniref:helix-turn-helix transcriptional regulator n=1 Tax=Lysinibacillus irui TaxID=2998077 RepID=UPI0040448C00